jgi:hypothetical protein
MTVHLANPVAIVACDAINARINSGSANGGKGMLRIYSGTRPATANDALTTQTKLIEFTLPNPAFQAAVQVGATGTATANAIAPTTAIASGNATFFRIVNSDGVTIFDGDVTDTTGNGDLKLSTVAVTNGIDVTVVSLTAIMPEGT